MHIPDGFLAAPVWATLDVITLPAVVWIAKRADSDAADELARTRIPLFGMVGAFVFAAQMINFPVGGGTSGHLLGGTLLAVTLGPVPAALVMTTVLILQALLFQDGGVLALGANVFNMALAGVLVGYLPCALGGRSAPTLFLGGLLSVCVSGELAVSQLILSGVSISPRILTATAGLFFVAGLLEGAITVAVFRMIEHLKPEIVKQPAKLASRARILGTGAILVLAAAGTWVASVYPDGLERLGGELGLRTTPTWPHAPFPDYEADLGVSGWMRKLLASLIGLALTYVICTVAGNSVYRFAGRQMTKRAEAVLALGPETGRNSPTA